MKSIGTFEILSKSTTTEDLAKLVGRDGCLLHDQSFHRWASLLVREWANFLEGSDLFGEHTTCFGENWRQLVFRLLTIGRYDIVLNFGENLHATCAFIGCVPMRMVDCMDCVSASICALCVLWLNCYCFTQRKHMSAFIEAWVLFLANIIAFHPSVLASIHIFVTALLMQQCFALFITDLQCVLTLNLNYEGEGEEHSSSFHL